MGRLEFPISEHRKIRRSAGVRAACRKIANEVAQRAESIADAPNGYGVEESVGSDRVRVNVYAQTGEAVRAETKSAPLLQAATQTRP